MIQRIQTLFLVLASLMTLVVFFTPIYSRSMEDPQQWIGIGLAVLLSVSIVISLLSIFRYADRKDQMKWVKIAATAQIMGLGFCLGVLFSLGGIGSYLWDEALGTGFAFLALVLQFLALRFIKKDDELVRSMDRIR